MIDTVKEVFEALGFHCQAVHFRAVFPDEPLRRVIEKALPISDVARILRYFPDLFALHSVMPPQIGAFFVRVFDGPATLTEDELVCYREYYPEKILVVVRSNITPGLLQAQWLWKCSRAEGKSGEPLPRLSDILTNDLGVEILPGQVRRAAELGYVI